MATRDCPDGAWFPVADRKVPVVEFVPPAFTPGPVAVIQADGTAFVTDHVTASRRSQR